MMKNIPFTLILCFLAGLCGCAQNTPSHFYTLSAMAQPAAAKFQHTLSVGPVLIPPVIDRPQMVMRLGQNQVKFDEFNRWAVPLQEDIARVIAENLAVKLGSPRVTLFPQSPPDTSAIRVAVDIQKFESNEARTVAIDAQWTIRIAGDPRTVTGRTNRQESFSGSGYDDQVAAYNQALAHLSDDIARALLDL